MNPINRNRHATAFLLGILAVAFTACGDKEEAQQPARQPIVLTGEIFSTGSDVGTVWSGGQAIGVYMLKNNTQEIVDNYANVKHLADNRGATGYLVPADNVPMYLPEDGSKVDIRAYYPYSVGVTSGATRSRTVHTLDVTIDEKTKPDGYLYSQNGSGISSGNASATLQLTSILAVVKVNFLCTLKNAHSISAELQHMPTQGAFDLIEGRFTQYDIVPGEAQPMTGNKTQETASVTFAMQAVVLPGLLNEDIELAVSVYDPKGELLKTYTPIELHKVLELQNKQLPENTQYDVTAQLTESNDIETQLVGTSAICILNWTGGEEDPEGGIARPDSNSNQ